MTFVEHSLGESEHIYARSNLKLKSRCSVKLSSSLATVFPFSILFKELDTLVTSAAWVARGNGLRISMQLVTNDLTTQRLDRQTLIESLSALFCSAELWKQLNLKACLIPHSENQGLLFPSGDLCFSLSNLRSTKGSAEKSGGNIVLPAHDVKQPFGVPCAFLEHIQMTFIFSSLGVCSSTKRSKLTSGEDLATHMLFTDGHVIEYLNQSALPQHLVQWPMLLSLEHDRRSQSATQQSDNIRVPRKLLCGHQFTSDLPHSFQDCILGSPFQSLFEKLPPLELPEKRAASDCFPNEKKILLDDLLKLFDAGLRTMICGDKILPLSGVTSSIRHLGPKLAEISPAMFRPGYLPTIWEHYRFFDTIAHTTSMTYSHKSSVGLQSKIDALKCFSPDEFEGSDMLDERMPRTPEHVLTNAIKVRLWRMIVTAILRRPGISAIKPLDWTDPGPVRSQDAQIMLKEESSLRSGNVANFRSKEIDDALLFSSDEEESDGLLKKQNLFREDGLNSEHDALDEDLLCGDCITAEVLDMHDDQWIWEGEVVSKNVNAGDRKVHSDSDSEILFEDDEDILLDVVVLHHEHDSSMHSVRPADHDEMLLSD